MNQENATSKQPLIRYVNRQQMSWRAVDVEQLISEDHRARARGDAKLGNLLEQSGFESLTQLMKAYRGELTYYNGTAWRDWVDWELETAFSLGKGICGIRLKDSRGQAPQLLTRIGAPIVRWGDVGGLISVIEAAAARRS